MLSTLVVRSFIVYVLTLPSIGFCGFMSVLTAMRYCIGAPEDLSKMWVALGLMPFGLFFDFMDGKVARWRHKSSLMGQELDSLADLVRTPIPSQLIDLAQSPAQTKL